MSLSSADYPGNDQIIAGLRAETFESQVEKHAAWVGSPARIAEQVMPAVSSSSRRDSTAAESAAGWPLPCAAQTPR